MSMTFNTLAKQNAVFPSQKDHFADIRHLRFDKSALTKHVLDNEHFVDWINAKILDFWLHKTPVYRIVFHNQIPNTMNDKQN